MKNICLFWSTITKEDQIFLRNGARTNLTSNRQGLPPLYLLNKGHTQTLSWISFKKKKSKTKKRKLFSSSLNSLEFWNQLYVYPRHFKKRNRILGHIAKQLQPCTFLQTAYNSKRDVKKHEFWPTSINFRKKIID